MSNPIRLILFGLNPDIGTKVIAGLKPHNYEVTYFLSSVDAGKRDLPDLLAGKAPTHADNDNIGTRNYGEPPSAVVFGGAFRHGEDIEGLRAALGKDFTFMCPWLRADTTETAIMPPNPKYHQYVLDRLITRLDELQKNGELGADGKGKQPEY